MINPHPIKRFRTGDSFDLEDTLWNPQTLYHYTTREGLIAILGSGTVWATSIRFLNDSSEYKYAQRLFKSKLHEIRERLPDTHKEWVDKAIGRIRSSPDIFVFCLSVNGDQLSQWRAYGQPGNGYAIGFDAPALDRIIRKKNIQLAKVCYERRQQWELMNRIEMAAGARSRKAGSDNPEGFAEALHEIFLELGAVMKHPAFIEESEWRILLRCDSLPGMQVKHRAGRSFLVPYAPIMIKLKSQPMPVRSIIIGPNTHPALDKEAVRGLCRQFGIKAQIFKSTIPYRAA
jgi:hypothetical protein